MREITDLSVSKLEHDYDIPVFTWDGEACTAVQICKNDDTHTITYSIDENNLTIVEDESKYVHETCKKEGRSYMVASVTAVDGQIYTSEQVFFVPTLPHTDTNKDGVCDHQECGENICTHEDDNYTLINVVPATCTTNGYRGDKYCSACHTIRIEEDVDKVELAFGHAYTATAVWNENYVEGTTPACEVTFTCEHDDTHTGTVNAVVTTVSEESYAPTCTADGRKTFAATATYDGATFDSTTYTEIAKKSYTVAKTGHSYTIAYNWSEDCKTCDVVFACAYNDACSVTRNKTVENGGVIAEVKFPATCLEDGATLYTVSDTYTDDNGVVYNISAQKDILDIKAPGHKYSDWVSGANNTHTKTCTVCKNELEREVTEDCFDSATDADCKCDVCGQFVAHTEVIVQAVAPTCTKAGHTEGKYCSVCNETIAAQTEVPALGHTYSAWTAAANKTHTKTCIVCTDEPNRVVVEKCVDSDDDNCTCDTCYQMLNHTPGSVVKENIVKPDCTNPGSHDDVRYCSVCGVEVSRSHAVDAANGHNYSQTVTVPTCTEQGYTTFTCHCGDSYIGAYIPANGHTFVDHAAKLPTCTEDGWLAYKTCSKCDYNTYTVAPATGHTEVIDEALAPTCESMGATEGKHCSVCNLVLVIPELIPATGHEYAVGELIRPTQNANGTWSSGFYTYVCANDSAHTYLEATPRADYSRYEAYINEFTERLADASLHPNIRAEIQSLLAGNAVEQNLVAAEQNQIEAVCDIFESNIQKFNTEYTVTFVDADGRELAAQTVAYGHGAAAPENPISDGYLFIGWDIAYDCIKANTTVTAEYIRANSTLALDVDTLYFTVGESQKVAATISPENVAADRLLWKIADTSVAKVDANGVVTAVGHGTTTLTVSLRTGGLGRTIAIYVSDASGKYVAQLVKSPYGNFMVDGNMFYQTGYVNVGAGKEFKFRFALSSQYDPADFTILANGQAVTVDEDNYFTIPFMYDNMTIIVVPIGDIPVEPDTNPIPEDDNCMCHSSNKIIQFIWKILAFFYKLFGVSDKQYCACGKAHW